MSTQTQFGAASLTQEKANRVRAEIELVLQSHGFRKSERHSRFLRFVCEASLNGEAAQLNEYLIAHQVFERGNDYSPGEDSVVRRQAFSLRQKLQEYYKAEGKDDSVRIELPIGRYVPTFHFAEPQTVALPQASAAEIAEPLPPTVEERDRRIRPWMLVVLVAVAVLLSSTAGWIAGSKFQQRVGGLDPAFYQVWGPWLSTSEANVICFSNALTAGIRRTEQPFPETNLTRGIQLSDQEADRIRKQFHFPAGGYFYINPALAHAKMGEALGSVPLAALFVKAGVPVRTNQSRYLNWQDFRNQNLVLLGHDEANQWLDPLLGKLPFRLARTTTLKPRRIVIDEPHPGEQQEYFPDYTKGQSPAAEDYALISLVSGIDGHHRLALINGVNTEGTLMALEYLTEAVSVRALELALIKVSPQHSGAWHFQAILHSELRDGVPTGIELVALRVLP